MSSPNRMRPLSAAIVALAFELTLQPCPDLALHAAAERPDQRPSHPEPPLRAHLPVPDHDGVVALGGEGQRPEGLHHRACRARSQPVRPGILGELYEHLHALLSHVRTETCALPYG